jgi:hypothetical protein
MIEAIARRFYDPSMLGMALMGSRARGEAQAFSDVDLVCLTTKETAPEPDTHYVDGQLVVVSYVTLEQAERWFVEPRQIVEVISNLRQAHILIDEQGVYATLQHRAEQFQWTDAHQAKANAYVSNELVGLIEEVHKGLNCLASFHAGRFINATHGLAWGLTYIVLVYHGVLAGGDNTLITSAQQAVGYDSEWSRLHRIVYGLVPSTEVQPTRDDQLRASLRLYQLTYEMCQTACTAEHQTLIRTTLNFVDMRLA